MNAEGVYTAKVQARSVYVDGDRVQFAVLPPTRLKHISEDYDILSLIAVSRL